jgi:hypothetical protein
VSLLVAKPSHMEVDVDGLSLPTWFIAARRGDMTYLSSDVLSCRCSRW